MNIFRKFKQNWQKSEQSSKERAIELERTMVHVPRSVVVLWSVGVFSLFFATPVLYEAKYLIPTLVVFFVVGAQFATGGITYLRAGVYAPKTLGLYAFWATLAAAIARAVLQ